MRNSRSLPLMRSIHTSPLCNDGFPIAPRSESILAVLAGTAAAFSVFVEDGPAAAPHPPSVIARKISAAAASRPNVVCPSMAQSGFLARMHSYGDATELPVPSPYLPGRGVPRLCLWPVRRLDTYRDGETERLASPR